MISKKTNNIIANMAIVIASYTLKKWLFNISSIDQNIHIIFLTNYMVNILNESNEENVAQS